MNKRTAYALLAGRLLMAAIFILSGAGKIAAFSATVGYISSQGIPLATLAAVLAIVVELGGGLMLLVGWKTRWAAAVIAVFTVFAAVIFHNFWAVAPDQVQNTMIHFMKNFAMVGGLLYMGVFGAGSLSVDKN
jgi:putative oxidoreductase